MLRKSLLFLVLISFCSTIVLSANKYKKADEFLKGGDYEMAVKYYYDIMEAKGGVAISNDVRALIGAAIAHYMMQEYKKSFALCKKVLKIESYHSAAIFFAGQNLEALGNDRLALNLYKYYAVLQPYDPYYYYIKSRYEFVNQKIAESRIKKFIQMEGKINTQDIPDNSIAILYFVNESRDMTWDVFSKGFAQILINDFSHIGNLEVIGRQDIQILLDKLQFSTKALNDENLIPRLGRLLNAKTVVSGSFNVVDNSNININVGFLNLSHPDLIEQAKFSGPAKDVFSLEKKIIYKIVSELNIPLSSAEKRKISSIATDNISAFLDYCEGLDAYDRSDYTEASSYFNLATKKDSRFYLAESKKKSIEAIIVMNSGNLATNHFNIATGGYIASSQNMSLTKSRFFNVSNNLDLGYLPGNDSRNATGGVNIANFYRNVLPKPTPPPSN